MRIANLLKGFGVSGSPPATPTLVISDSEDGSGGVGTVSGSSSGSVNTIYYVLLQTGAQGEQDWSVGGVRDENGDVELDLDVGSYLFVVISTKAGSSAVSNPVFTNFTDSSGGVGIVHSPAHIMRDYLLGIGDAKLYDIDVGAVSGSWPAYITYLPDTAKVDAVVFINSTGLKDGRDMNTGRTHEHPGVQLRVRASDEQSAWRKIKRLTELLDVAKLQFVTIDGVQYLLHAVTRVSNIIQLSQLTQAQTQQITIEMTQVGYRTFVVNLRITVTKV